MKLEQEQIIKALEWCSELRLCVDCPMRAMGYNSYSGNACRKVLMENALSLITGLTEEHERQVDTNLKLVAENVMFMLDKNIEDINKIGAVRHGHWMSENRRPKSYQFRCSVCDGVTYYLHRNEKGEKQCLYKYCPYCGAVMEEGKG